MASYGSIKKPGTYEKVKPVSGVVGGGGSGGVFTPSGQNILLPPEQKPLTEEQTKEFLQKEIEIRQAGGEGTKIEGGFLSLYKTPEIDLQREKAVADMQRAKAIEDLKAKEKEALIRQQYQAQTIDLRTGQSQRQDYINRQIELMNQQRQDSINTDYYKKYNIDTFKQKSISKPDEQGVSTIIREKEIPQVVRDTKGNVYFKYKDGSKILIDQLYTEAPDYLNQAKVKGDFLGYDTYGKPVYKTTKEIKQPSSEMGVWNPRYEKEYYQKPSSQIAKEFFGILGQDIKKIVGREELNLVNPFEAFKGSGKRISETLEPVSLTLSNKPFKTFEELIGKTKEPRKTLGELQEKQDIEILAKQQPIIEKYNKKYTETYEMINKKVSEGKIDVNEANKLLESKSKDININLNKELSKIKIPQRYYKEGEQTGDVIASLSKTGVESASLLNPATASLMGAYKFSKLPTTDEYTYYNKQTGKTETVYPTEKASFMEKAEATSFLVLGGLSAGAKTRKLAKEIVEEELSLASKQPIGFKEIQAIGREGEATKVVMKGGSTFRGLKTNIEVTGKVYPLPGDKTGKAFIMPSGTGEARISGETSFTLFGKGQPTYIAGIQEFEVGAKGVTFNIGKGELSGITDLGLGISKVSSIKGRAFGTIGTGTSIPTEGTSIIYTTEEVSPYLNFPSPNIKYLSERQIKKQSKELAEGFVKGYQTGGEITKELTTAKSMQLKKDLFFTVTEKGDIGLTKVIYPKAETEINIFRGGGTKTPLSKTFQVTEEKGILGISKIIEKPVSKITKSLSEGIIKQIPKETISPFFAGSVLIEKEGKLGEGNRFGNLIGTGRIGSLGVTGKFGDLGVTETGFEGLEVSELAKTKTRTEQETKTREKESLVSATSLLTGLTIKTSEEFKQPSALAQPSRQKEATKQKQESLLVISPQPIKLTPRITYPEEFGWGFGVGLPRREKGKKREQNAYLPQVYRDATKRMKAHWETISKTPMTKQSALSESAREVDNAISSRGRVIKTKGKPIDTGEDYFGVNRQKFRTYSQKGGVKRQLPNSFIEKRAYRLDSPNETKTIQREKRKSIDIKRMFGI